MFIVIVSNASCTNSEMPLVDNYKFRCIYWVLAHVHFHHYHASNENNVNLCDTHRYHPDKYICQFLAQIAHALISFCYKKFPIMRLCIMQTRLFHFAFSSSIRSLSSAIRTSFSSINCWSDFTRSARTESPTTTEISPSLDAGE